MTAYTVAPIVKHGDDPRTVPVRFSNLSEIGCNCGGCGAANAMTVLSKLLAPMEVE